MITINSNSSAMMAQNNLFKTQSALKGNMMQLSTGKRINSAADDAAGLQIFNRMATQMNGLGVAQRNANDAISMAQTAEGAVSENGTTLNRMRNLALQSANDTNTDKDRAAMQKEVKSLVAEVDRIADTTNFAGTKLLDGTNFSRQHVMDNWYLSSYRANEVRQTLIYGGFPEERIVQVAAMVDRSLVDKDNPSNPVNRRVEIVVMTADSETRLTGVDYDDLSPVADTGHGEEPVEVEKVLSEFDTDHMMDVRWHAEENRMPERG